MPTALFDSFDNLDQIDINSLISRLKNPPTPTQLENYLANKILYPETLPLTDFDMQIDLAILREALQISNTKSQFLNTTLRKIIIPRQFLSYVPSLLSLVWAFVDGLLMPKRKEFFGNLWTVILVGDINETLGSVLLPQFGSVEDKMDLVLPGKKSYQIKAGSLIVIPCDQDRCEISYKFNLGQLLGQRENAIEVYGGKLGLMIDGRIL